MSKEIDNEKEIIQKRIGRNIKTMREARGLKQSELADILELHQRNYLFYYEKGEKAIPAYLLLKVAEFFSTSTDQIMKEEFPSIEEIEFDFDGANENLDIIFPFVKTDKEMENYYFKSAYKEHCEFFERLKKTSIDRCIEDWGFLDCIERYQMAFEDENSKCKEEAAINSIGLLYYLLVAYKTSSKLLFKNTFIQKALLEKFPSLNKHIITVDENEIEGLNEAFNEIYEILNEYKQFVYKGEKYKDILDYYLALQYKLCVVDNEFDLSRNEPVGLEMLLELRELGNAYAKNYLKVLNIK